MATIINNPGGGNNDDHHDHESGVGTGVIIGIVLAIILGILLFYVIPALRSRGTPNNGTSGSSTTGDGSPAPQVNLPSNINVNVTSTGK